MPELLPGAGSDVVEATEAELVTWRDAMPALAVSVLTVSEMVAVPFAAIVPRLHVMLDVVVAQVPWEVVYEATVSPLGNASFIVAPCASLWPEFDNVMV